MKPFLLCFFFHPKLFLVNVNESCEISLYVQEVGCTQAGRVKSKNLRQLFVIELLPSKPNFLFLVPFLHKTPFYYFWGTLVIFNIHITKLTFQGVFLKIKLTSFGRYKGFLREFDLSKGYANNASLNERNKILFINVKIVINDLFSIQWKQKEKSDRN